MSKPSVRKKPSNPQPAKPTKAFKANMALLEAYGSTNALIRTLQKSVTHRYENRDIRNVKTGLALMKFLENNEMEKFSKKWGTIDTAGTKKRTRDTERRETRNAKEAEEENKLVRGIEREVFKPKLKTKDGGTEAPTYEVEFVKDYRNFEESWEAGLKKLIRMTEAHMKTKPNIKLTLGCSFTAIKQKMNPANDSFDEVELNVVDEQRVRYEIDPRQLYNVESVKPTIRNLRAQMINGFAKALEKFKGSGWSVKRIDSLFAITHTLKAARGSSYIITPTKWRHPKCGLINIQNHDQECFRWCMLYHQSEQKEKSHRTTALAKLTEKCDYTGITFPISYDHITAFEHMNSLTINVWKEDEESKKTYLHRPGNVMYCRNGLVNLLLVENEQGEAHYIYIKQLEHLLHTNTRGFYKDRKFCPFCSKPVDCKHETFA